MELASTAYSNYSSYSEALRAQDETDQAWADLLSNLGNRIWNFFKVGLCVSSADQSNHAGVSQTELTQPLVQLSESPFATNLESVSSTQHTEGKKLTAHLYDRTQLCSIFKKVKQDIKQSDRLGDLADEIALSLQVLNKRSTEKNLSTEEKAEISMSLNRLAIDCQRLLETKGGELSLRDQWIIGIINDLNTTFDYWSRESLAEKIRVELADKKQTKLGQLHSKSSRIMAGVATPGSQLGTYKEVGVKGQHDRIDMVDAERFRNKYDLWIGGVYVEGAAGVETPEAEIVKAQLKGTLDIQMMGGTFTEPKTAMDEVTRDFTKLIQKPKYRDDANIAPYFSRAKLLNQETDGNVVDEVSNIVQVRKNFTAKKAGIDSRLSLYMSSVNEQTTTDSRLNKNKLDQNGLNNESDQPTLMSASVKVAAGEVTEAIVFGGIGRVTFGGEAKAEAKIEIGAGDDNTPPVFSAGIGAHTSAVGTGELMARNRSEVKRTPISQRYADVTKTIEEKASIKQQVAANLAVFKNRLIQNWTTNSEKMVHTELGKKVLLMANTVVEPETFSQFLAENNLDPALLKLRDRAILLRSGKSNPDELRKKLNEAKECWQLFESTPQLVTKSAGKKIPSFDTSSLDNIEHCLQGIKYELAAYAELRDAEVGPGKLFLTQEAKQRAIREFENRWGATNADELIHRMHIAITYLLTHIDVENLDNDAKVDDLIDDILAFEKTLLSCRFIVDQSYIDDRLNFLEDLSITLYQAQLKVETKTGASAFIKVGSPVGGTTESTDTSMETNSLNINSTPEDAVSSTPEENEGGLKVFRNTSLSVGGFFKTESNASYNYLSGHRNILRKGHSLQFSASIGLGCNVDAIIQDVTPGFASLLPADIAQNALSELKLKLLQEVALSRSWTSERTIEIYLAKPNQLSKNGKGFSLRVLYTRASKTEIVDTTVKKKLALSTYTAGFVPFDLVGGGGSLNIDTEPTDEMTASSSILQSSIQYQHAYDVGEIDRVTGVVQDDCYVREGECKPEFSEFFDNLANDSDDENSIGDINHELDEFEIAVNDNPNYIKQLLVNFQTARRATTDPDRIAMLTEKITAVRAMIKANEIATQIQTSNDLDGVLKEYNFKTVRKNLKDAANKSKGLDHAVDCYRKLQHAFSPHYLESKSNSPDLKPRRLTALSTVAEWIEQAKIMSSAIMMPHGSLPYS